MNQEELRLHRCCFTGHRPDKMELGEKEIKPLLEKAIDDAIANGYVKLSKNIEEIIKASGKVAEEEKEG